MKHTKQLKLIFFIKDLLLFKSFQRDYRVKIGKLHRQAKIYLMFRNLEIDKQLNLFIIICSNVLLVQFSVPHSFLIKQFIITLLLNIFLIL